MYVLFSFSIFLIAHFRVVLSFLPPPDHNTMLKKNIYKTQRNTKCRFCGDRDEMINHMISECCKLVQKEYKTRHNLIGKVIHRETRKKFKFDHTNKWYMHNPESVLGNETGKLLCDFEILTVHLILARQPDKKREYPE